MNPRTHIPASWSSKSGVSPHFWWWLHNYQSPWPITKNVFGYIINLDITNHLDLFILYFLVMVTYNSLLYPFINHDSPWQLRWLGRQMAAPTARWWCVLRPQVVVLHSQGWFTTSVTNRCILKVSLINGGRKNQKTANCGVQIRRQKPSKKYCEVVLHNKKNKHVETILSWKTSWIHSGIVP